MSVLLYESVDLIDPGSPTVTNMKAVEVKIVLAVLKGNNRVHKASYFSVTAATWGLAIQKAYETAEEIERLSRGVLVKIETKLGKYIKDAPLEEITDRQKSGYATFKTVDGAKKTSVSIPFMRTDLSEDEFDSVLEALDLCLLMKDPFGTGVLMYRTNILMGVRTSRWDKEPAGVVDSGNIVDQGDDGFLGNEIAEPLADKP